MTADEVEEMRGRGVGGTELHAMTVNVDEEGGEVAAARMRRWMASATEPSRVVCEGEMSDGSVGEVALLQIPSVAFAQVEDRERRGGGGGQRGQRTGDERMNSLGVWDCHLRSCSSLPASLPVVVKALTL